VKLLKKKRVGSKLRRQYGPAQTPLDRAAQCEEGIPERVAEWKNLRSQLDPFELSQTIDRKLQRLYRLAHQRLSPGALPGMPGERI
jgi:adenosine deaminase